MWLPMGLVKSTKLKLTGDSKVFKKFSTFSCLQLILVLELISSGRFIAVRPWLGNWLQRNSDVCNAMFAIMWTLYVYKAEHYYSMFAMFTIMGRLCRSFPKNQQRIVQESRGEIHPESRKFHCFIVSR